MEIQMLEFSDKDFKVVIIIMIKDVKKKKKKTLVMNEDGNRNLHCCLWAGCTWR